MVSGMVAGTPFHGGASWAVLQYVLGLRRMGHRVLLVEPVDGEAGGGPEVPLSSTSSAAYFDEVIQRFALQDSAALLRRGTRETVGVPYSELLQFCDGADLLLNLSGLLREDELLQGIQRRTYLDLDPAFTQLWHEVEGIDMGFDGHDRFVTVGLSVGRAGCPVPTCGITWLPTLPPVVLDEWPASEDVRIPSFTTVANWRGYGSVEHEGVHYGQKAHALRELFPLPERSRASFTLALAIDAGEDEDLAALQTHGWSLVDPGEAARNPDRYAAFVRHSLAEFGVAKTGYTRSRCGWFSDRSACYLASGRPVLAQETGFETRLPVGEGLLSFGTLDDAVAAADRIQSDPDRHARAARELAEAWFDSRRVLTRLLDLVGGSELVGAADVRGPQADFGAPGRSGVEDKALAKALQGTPTPRSAAGRRVTRLVRRSSPYASSFPLEEVDASLDDGSRIQAILKDVSIGAQSSGSRAARSPFTHVPLREVEVYRLLLGPCGIGPEVLATGGGEGEAWLLLERVSGRPLFQEGDFSMWIAVARWLARFHRRFVDSTGPAEAHLLPYDAGFLRACASRARKVVEADEGIPSSVRRRFDLIWSRHDTMVDRLTSGPPTLVHGDFYPSNILVARAGAEAKKTVDVRPVDWELCGRGSGLLDLAALIAGDWPEERRLELALAYGGAVPPPSPWPPGSRSDFLESLHWARLHLALQWIGARGDWRPPEEHDRDWVEEAMLAADALSL